MSPIDFLKEFWPHLTFLVASAVGIYKWRIAELRHSDALFWSNQCINTAQRTYLKMLSCLTDKRSFDEEIKALALDASVLVEQGRLLFKNVTRGVLSEYGKDKPIAYRGIRPTILDWMLCVYEAADRWETASGEDRVLLMLAVETAERNFVSLAQQEVGRVRTSSKASREPGHHSPLDMVLKELRSRGHASDRHHGEN